MYPLATHYKFFIVLILLYAIQVVILENIRGRFGIYPELNRNLRLTRPMLYRFQCTTVELYIPILLSHRDSNPNLQNQNLSCYHYTMRQFSCFVKILIEPLELSLLREELCKKVFEHLYKIAINTPQNSFTGGVSPPSSYLFESPKNHHNCAPSRT